MANMKNNMKKEWNDDERDTKDYIQHYSEGYDKKQNNSIVNVIKEVVRDEYTRITNMHWNEVEYRSYANEPAYVPYEVLNDIMDDNVDDCSSSKVDTVVREDENDLTYQGLVKNKFMYS